MNHVPSRYRRAVFALATAAALGFGATQVLATSAPVDGPERACTSCKSVCGDLGGRFVSGRCLCCG